MVKTCNEKSRLLTLNTLSIKEQSHIYHSLIQWGVSTKVRSKNMCSGVLKGYPARNKLVMVKTTRLKAKPAPVGMPMCRNPESDLFLEAHLARWGTALSGVGRDYLTKHF